MDSPRGGMFPVRNTDSLRGVSSHSKKTTPPSPSARKEACSTRTTNHLYQKRVLVIKSAKDDMDHVFTDFRGGSAAAGRRGKADAMKRHESALRAQRSLTVASVFCLLFMVAQAIGGYAAGSLAIMTDAAHLFSDFISLLISLFSLCLTKRQPSVSMTFGWHRAEVIGALISLLMIWGITAALVFVAIERLRAFQFDIKAELMLITASVGVCFNIIMALVLHKSGDIGMHGHSHGCSSSSYQKLEDPHHNDEEMHVAKPIDSSDQSSKSKSKHRLSVRAALLHVVSDFMQSSAVLLAAVVIYCKPNMAFIDPMCTFLFSFLVLLTTIPILKEIIGVLMEGAPSHIDPLEIVQSLRKLDGVERVSNLRVWALNTDRSACTVHLDVDVMLHNWRSVLENATNLLSDKFRLDECTVQIVPSSESNGTRLMIADEERRGEEENEYSMLVGHLEEE